MPLNDIFRQRTQALVASLTSYRILLYALVSTLAVSAAIANALKNQSNFYSVAIYLSKSNRSVVVLVNFGFLVALLCGHIAQRIFFGPLRAPEIERLYDRLWFFVTESLLAFTIFRDEFDIPFALMFTFLLFIKSFHWLAADRIDWMDQRPYPGPPLLFHVRMSSLFLILWSTDCLMFLIAAQHTLTHEMSGMVLFASEYAILMASALNAVAKYTVSVFDLRRASRRGGENAPPWENKSVWIFYIELTTDFLKLTTYLIFFTIIIIFYGLPLNIIRDVYITARSFVTRLRALRRYQAATRNMDQRYPNATQEEMTLMSDHTCIICREEMVLSNPPENAVECTPDAQAPPPPVPGGPNTTPKKLPCGHIFHFHCLRSWLERQQSCPTCRRTVLETSTQAQQAHAGGPAPPQPGVAPQPNLFGAGQQNPIGILGRMFGIANQPPLVPGQFAQGPLPAAANIPLNHANLNPGPVPPAVVVQYTIQYHLLRRPPQPQPQPQQPPQHQQFQPQLQPHLHPQPQLQQQQQPQTHSLRPVPRFSGFQGPGGIWHPWGMDPQWFEPDPENVAPQSPSASTSAPTPTQAEPQAFPAPVSPTPNNESPQPGNGTTVGSDTLPEYREMPREVPGPSRTASPESVETASSITPSSPVSTRGSFTSNEESVNGESSFKVPMLIPWHDHGAATVHPSHTWAQHPQASTQRPIYGAPTTQAQPYRAHTRPAWTPADHRQPPANPRPSQTTHRPPISQLPPTLTDEQLAVMDTLTREAIDERLRVLEGVSGAVYRCIDDLLRMRSALPSPTTPPTAAAASPIILESSEITPIETPLTTGDHIGASGAGSKATGPGPKAPEVDSLENDSPQSSSVAPAQSGSVAST